MATQALNPHSEATPFVAGPQGRGARDTSLPPGAGLALAVVLGALMWVGIFALVT